MIHGLVDLRVDPYIKARLAFEWASQETVAGPNVRVRVRLSRALPVAVRVPYSVSGTAAKTDYGSLSPSPEVGILFRAGETVGEIAFTTAENSEALGKTVVLTLGDLSEIRLRRSDGAGNDAPGLDAGALVVRPSVGVVHTVTIVDPDQTVDVCDRTPQVRDKLGGAYRRNRLRAAQQGPNGRRAGTGSFRNPESVHSSSTTSAD